MTKGTEGTDPNLTRCLMTRQQHKFQTFVPSRCYSETSGQSTDYSQQHSDPGFSEDRDTSSSSQTEESQYEYDIRQRILAASLPYVSEMGWTQKALEAGAKDEGLPEIAHGMFPRGGAELVNFFYRRCNQELAEILSSEVEKAKAAEEKIKTAPFIQEAVETRLRMIFPYIDVWPQAMAIQTLPQNAYESWTNTLNLMDEIWYYAGDRSTDFNWYTKRMALYGVYKATEIYMLQDNSVDKEETWSFLKNRLSDLETLGSCKRACEQNTEVFKEAAKGLSIMGRNLLGFNSRDR